MSDKDVVGAVVDEMYAMISGSAGPRDWPRQAVIFHPDSRQIRTWVDGQGRSAMKAMTPDD